MNNSEKIYRKQDSFVEIRHKNSLEDILPRIWKVRENLGHFPLSQYEKSIVSSACNDLLEKSLCDSEYPLFALHSYTIEDINRLGDIELPRYLFYRYRYDTFPQQLKLDGFPPCLQIEPTSICNYRCPFCYQTDKEFAGKSRGEARGGGGVQGHIITQLDQFAV